MPYVYRHIRLDKNEPFYIGIGSDKKYKRAFEKTRRNKMWYDVINKTDYEVDILIDELTWEQACEKEKEFISLYGRKNIGTGTLSNLTDGGEGTTGAIMSKEWRENLSNKLIGNKRGIGRIRSEKELNDLKNRMIGNKYGLGYNHTEESKMKISIKNKGKKRNEEAIKNISESQKGKKLSEETKLKVSMFQKGRPKSEEHKRKISEARKRYWKLKNKK
jgi:hypothetical protein